SSGLLIIIVVFFLYTIGIILKQKKLSEIKTDFINNMTHELKTPIATISLTSKALLKPEIITLPEKLFKYVEIISKENDRLQMQVEKVLQIAALEKEQTNLHKSEVDVHDILN